MLMITDYIIYSYTLMTWEGDDEDVDHVIKIMMFMILMLMS